MRVWEGTPKHPESPEVAHSGGTGDDGPPVRFRGTAVIRPRRRGGRHGSFWRVARRTFTSGRSQNRTW